MKYVTNTDPSIERKNTRLLGTQKQRLRRNKGYQTREQRLILHKWNDIRGLIPEQGSVYLRVKDRNSNF